MPRSNNNEKSKTTQVRNNANCSSPPHEKTGTENIEERGVREREKTEVNLLFMMRAGPISAQQFQTVQSFQ